MHASPFAAPGFDGGTQRVISFALAGLDDQSRILHRAVADLAVPALEWQPGPGHNSVGMLVAHVALAEAWWVEAARSGVGDRPGLERRVRDLTSLGLDDDGMPAPPTGGHPTPLKGRSATDYLGFLSSARGATRATLSAWDDASLSTEIVLEKRSVTRGWILYHLIEHTASHAGQVMRIRHDLRDAGVLPP